MKTSFYTILSSLLIILLIFSSCILLISPKPRMDYTFRFNIKNTTHLNIEVNLAIGKIPNLQAQFDEFELIPDEIYKLLNEYWSNNLGTHCIVKPNSHNNVVSYLPIAGLGLPLDTRPIEFQEKHSILYEYLLNKLISFILTISENGNIIYRIVGWDISDDDMEKYHVSDKLLGYYDTTPENYTDSYGTIRAYPLFFSKLINDETGTHFGGTFTFYIKSTFDNTFIQEFKLASTWVDEDDYWKKH